MNNLNLNSDNWKEFGFARFCYPKESLEVPGGLQREVELPDTPFHYKKVKVYFPKSDLVLLSDNLENKLVQKDWFQVISAGTDIAPMYLLSQRAGWNQTIKDLKLLTAVNPQANLLAIADIDGVSIPLGSGLVSNVGESLCWIGMILVHLELRRQGIATAITEKCIELVRLDMKQSIIGLDATLEGRSVYDKIGFRPSFKLWRSKLKTDTLIDYDHSIEITSINYDTEFFDFLKEINLGKKIIEFQLIQKLNPEGAWLARSEGKPVGIVMTRPGRLRPFIGPLVATKLDTARCLLAHALRYWKEKGHHEVFIDIPERHFGNLSTGNNLTELTPAPSECILSPEVGAGRGFIRMYEVISEKELAGLALRISKGRRHFRKVEALQHALSCTKETVEYMQNEVKTLRYLYSVGGPELS